MEKQHLEVRNTVGSTFATKYGFPFVFSWQGLNYPIHFQKQLKLGGLCVTGGFSLANTNEFSIKVCCPAKSHAVPSPLMFL